jgi:hypothetical protein
MKEGEVYGWDVLSGLDPAEVTKRTGVAFNAEHRSYTVNVYGRPVEVSLDAKTMLGDSEETGIVIDRYAYFSKISVLSYLSNAKDVMPTGHQVKPTAVGGLATFFQGSHALPVDKIAARYDGAGEELLEKAKCYNGRKGVHGDVSVCLEPFDRIPVELVIWFGDDEFPARGDLLFDSTCSLHVPADIIWSTAMMSILILF